MAELLSEVEYGRILGSFTAVAEDFGDTVAPDAIPLAGKVVFSPTISHVTYINSDGETASLYLHPVTASIVDGRLVGSEGNDGVVLLASNSNNVSASVLWNAHIYIDPIGPGQEAPEVYKFLIEVSRNEISSLIDVIKANSRVHNVALFHDAIAEAAAKFWERVEAGEFRGNQGPPGPAGVGIGMPGPSGRPGASGEDGEAGLGGNIIPDGDLEDPGFLIQGDYVESTDAYSGDKSVRLTHAVSRKIAIKPDKSYVGGVAVKADESVNVKITLRVFGHEGDIDRVIETTDTTHVGAWRELAFALDTKVGDQSLEIITDTDGRTITVDYYTLIDSTVIQGLQTRLSEAKAELDAAMANLAADLEVVDTERARLNESLNDLAAVLEDADVDLTVVNQELADLREDLTTEETRRQEADAAAQLIMDQLNIELSDAAAELEANKTLLAGLDTELTTSQEKLTQAETNITRLETVTLPNLKQTLENATQEVVQNLATLDDKLYGATGDITTAKANIDQLATDLDIEEQARLQLAQDISEDFTERDARLNAAEDTLATAFPDGAVNVSAELDRTIRDYVVEYAVSSSATIAPTTGWSVTSPTRSPGEYIWFRTKVVYGDGVASTSSAALLTGNEGEQGPKGEDGTDGADGTGITILGSFDTEDELPASGSLGDSYLVGGYLFVWTDTGWDNVGLIQGPQGVPGEAGADGQPTYTWVKYADTAEGLGMSDDPSGKRYIGLAFNKDVQTESTTATDYQWALFEGPEGPEGVKGDPGDQGEQGVGVESITPFFRDVVSGSSAPASPTVWDPTGWTTAEPAWAPNRDLYRTERIRYTNGTFAYTPATKIAAYAGIDAAMEAANGKNLNTYTDLAIASKPGPAPAPDNSRTVGDIHRNRDKSTGEIWAEYQWTGTAWQEVSFGDGVLSSLDVGKVTGGTGAFQKFFADNLIADNATINKLWTDQLVGKTAAFNQIAVASGNILVDPQGLDPSIRTNVGGASWAWDDEGRYWTRPAVQGGTTQFNAYTNVGPVYDSNLLDPGAMYVISYEVWVDKVGPDTAARAAIYYRNRDGSTSFVGDATEEGGDTDHWQEGITAGQWNKVTRHWRAPDDVLSGGINFQLLYGADDATEVRIRNPFVGKQAPAVLIEDGAISAEKVNAESVAGAVGSFIELETSQLVATDSIKTPEAVIDKLWADGISAKSIDTTRLTVSPSNLFPDPYFYSKDMWEVGERVEVIEDADYPNHNVLKITQRDIQTGTYFGAGSTMRVSVEPGATYRVRFQGRASKVGSRFGLVWRTPRTDEGIISTYSSYITSSTTDWETYDFTISVVSVSTGMVNFGFFDSSPFAAGETIEIRSVSITPMVGSVLIEDGAVNASKINAESVGAAVGEFVKLDVKNLTAGSANINSLVAQKIAAGTAAFQTVNADKIIASTGTMDSATINQIWADGIAAKAITTSRLVVGGSGGALVPFPESYLRVSRPHFSEQPDGSIVYDGVNENLYDNRILSSPIDGQYPEGLYQIEVVAENLSDQDTSATLYHYRYKGTSYSASGYRAGTAYDLPAGEKITHTAIEEIKYSPGETGFTIQTSINSPYVPIKFHSIRVTRADKVGAVLIEDGAISANHISSDSIDTEHLRANAITADKIGANEIVAGKIAANAVDTKQLRANAIDADKIAANAVIAGKIATDAVSSDTIQANAITSAKISAGAITAQKLDAGAVTAVKIEAGAVTTAKMTANSINGDRISAGTLDADKLNANTAMINKLWTGGLDAKTISTTSLNVSRSNMVVNGDGALGSSVGWPNYALDSGAPAETGAVNGFRSASASSQPVNEDNPFPLTAGNDYAIDVWMNHTHAGMDTTVEVRFLDFYGSYVSNTYPIWPKNVSSGLKKYSAEFTVPAGVTHGWIRLFPVHSKGGSGTTTFYNLRVLPMVGAVHIENGAITADKIESDAISADKIASGAVTTGHMSANSINGDRIKAGTLTAEKIIGGSFEGKTFTGGRFKGGEFQAPADPRWNGGVAIDPKNGIRGWSSSGTQTFQLDPGTGRVKIRERLEATNDSGRGVMLIPTTSSGGGGLWFSHSGYGGGSDAAIWRSGYDPNGVEPLYIRGANGGHVAIRGGLNVSQGGIISTHDITAFGTVSTGEYLRGDGILTGEIRLRNDGSPQIASKTIYDRTYSGSANVRVTSFGTLGRISSSRRYKKNIANWSPDPEAVLALRPRQWQHDDPEHNPEIDEQWYVGFIAEEVSDLGLRGLVDYTGDGAGGWRPESLRYDRFAAAHQIVLKKHEDEIKELRAEINELRSRM